MRIRGPLLLLVAACARPAPYGTPVRLVAGGSDTIVVNDHRPAALPIRALDASGRTVQHAPIRFSRLGGAVMPLDSAGQLTCEFSGDLTVRAELGVLSKRVLIRCRPVEWLRVPGPVQFVLGDSLLGVPRRFPVTAYGPDARPVTLVAGSVRVANAEVARFSGLALQPRSPGATLASVLIGGKDAAIGVHVYRKVGELNDLDTIMRIPAERRLVAVPLHLVRGELRRQPLPPGGWLITVLPANGDSVGGPMLRMEHAICSPVFGPRHFACSVGRDASIVLYRPTGRSGTVDVDGQLLVRWFAGQ